jgi:hypothetical protein
MVKNWWARQSFQLKLQERQGNCDFCWKKSDKKLVQLIRENPDGLNWWDAMERKHSHAQVLHRQTKLEPSYFFRGNRSAKEMRILSELINRQQNLFDDLSEYETDCFCKST